MASDEFRVVWKRAGCRRKERRFATPAAAERYVLLFGPEPWKAYGADPDQRPTRCLCPYECECESRTERERTEDERAKMPPLEYVRLERRPVGAWAQHVSADLNGGRIG